MGLSTFLLYLPWEEGLGFGLVQTWIGTSTLLPFGY